MSAHTLYVSPNLPTANAELSAAGNLIDPLSAAGNMIDPYGRRIDYLRLSVTDRCDLRCTYCMSEHMQFLPKPELLTLEELDVIASGFIAKGVKKLRITGGEPLVRRGIMELMEALSRHLKSGALGELTLTTNGTQLSKYAARLAALGVRRVNVSVDSFNADSFARITRGGDIAKVMAGIAAAQDAGLKVKINTVALRNDNADELEHMIRFAHERDMDLTLIETMPLGVVEADRFDQYIALSNVKQHLETAFTLTPLTVQTGGPARYYRCEDTGGILGLITPLSHNFCASCNRVRLTCTGKLYMCLGQNDAADLRSIVRGGGDLPAAIDSAIDRKPKAHDFAIDSAGTAPALARHMSVTGG